MVTRIAKTDLSKWQRWTCHERTCTVMPTGGSTPIFQTGTSGEDGWLDSVAACIERVTQHTYGLTRGQKCGRKTRRVSRIFFVVKM